MFIDAVVGSRRPPSRPEFVGDLPYLCHPAVLGRDPSTPDDRLQPA